MKSLGNEDSKKIALPEAPSPELEHGSATLLQKCDGLPLALVSVSDYLKSSVESTGKQCGELCRNLGLLLREEKHGHDNFAELRNILLDNYESLSGYARICLLYLGIFQHDRPLKRKVVIRRWLAEGYARSDPSRREEDVAEENFKMLIDRNIIRSIDTRNNAQVKTCRAHGIVHEFVLHKSVSRRFIAASSFNRQRVPCGTANARHLSIHGDDATYTYSGGASGKKGLSRVRSVTLSGNNNNAAEAITYVGTCKLLRVLDLEECSDLEDSHLKDIGKLLHLRYLSLGGSITKLPRSIVARLHCLETLDLRRTKVNTLPREAIELPHLVHLFGRFVLDKDDLKKRSKIRKLHKFFSEESNLQTLSGFDTHGEQGFLQFVGQMKNLRKMKIWCQSAVNGYLTDLSKAIQEFTKVPMVAAANQGAQSLSINSVGCSQAMLSSIDFERPCPDGFVYNLASLKLEGELLQGLPPFVALLSGLTELCISSASGTLTQDLLSALVELRCLLYLKLTAHQLESFEMRKGMFPSLERLCFVLQSPAPALPTMEEGALPKLVSLQLLCPWLDGLSGIKIGHLEHLKEVTIQDGMTEETRQDWERVVKNHPNRPTLKTVGETRKEASSVREKRRNCEPSTDDHGLDSGIKKIRLSVLEPPQFQRADSVSSSYSAQR